MTVFLKVGGILREYLKPDVDEYTRRVVCEPGQSLRQILDSVGVRPILVAMAIVDGAIVKHDYVPKEGDVITLRPPVQGG